MAEESRAQRRKRGKVKQAPPSRARERSKPYKGERADVGDVAVWWCKPRPEGDDCDPEIWKEVVGICDQLADEQKGRRETAMRLQAVYEGRDVESLNTSNYTQSEAKQSIEIGVARNIVDSLNEEIAAKQRPKPRFVTNGADWKQRRKAKWADRFIEAQFYQQQGAYSNIWELTEQVAHDAKRWGVGVGKTYADPESEKVVHERCFHFDFFVDDADAEYGHPKNLFHVYRYSRAELIARFPDHEDAIQKAQAPSDSRRVNPRRSGDMVEVREAWRLRIGQDIPGRHVIAVDGATLLDEDWDRDDFPIWVYRWSRDPFGFWGTGVCHVVETLQEEVNSGFRAIQENIELMGSGFLDVEDGAYEEGDLETNEAWKIMRRKPNTAPAQIRVPDPFSQSQLAFEKLIYDMAYELTGASRQAASARKEPGIEAAVAIQEINDLHSRRHMSKSRAYEQLFVQIGLKTMRSMRDLAVELGEEAIDLAWPGRKFLEPISFSDIADLRDDMYQIQVHSASSLPSTPGARIERVLQLTGAGFISPENADRIMSDTLDFEAYEERKNAQYEWVERLVERMLDADPDEWDNGLDYRGPDPLMPKPGAAIMQMTDAYFEALTEDAPDFNLGLLRAWVKDADAMISRVEQEKQKRAELQQQQAMMPGPGAPVPPGPPGMPPMPPGAPPMDPGQMMPPVAA